MTPPPKPPDTPIDTIILVCQPPKFENEPVDVAAIEPDLNMNFKEIIPQQKRIIHEVHERSGKGYLQESPKFHTQVNKKN